MKTTPPGEPTDEREALSLWARLKAKWPKSLTQQENELFDRFDACLRALSHSDAGEPAQPPAEALDPKMLADMHEHAFNELYDEAQPPVQQKGEGLTDAYMPSYGAIPWDVLRALVAEATMGRRDAKYVDIDPTYFIGHQPVSMNWNSLNRIVSAALASPSPSAPEGQSQADALDAKRYRWLRDRPSLIDWDSWIRPIPHYVSVVPELLDNEIDAALQQPGK